MSSIAEQVALNETALAQIKSENESLTSKLALSEAEIDRLKSDNDRLSSILDTYIKSTSRMQTLIDSAGVLLIEGRKTGDSLQSSSPRQTTPPSNQISEAPAHD